MDLNPDHYRGEAKTELEPTFSIDLLQEADLEEATEMRLQSWLDTYVSDYVGVTREWIEARNEQQRSPHAAKLRKEQFQKGVLNQTRIGWVARDEDRRIIGITTPYIDEDGSQHIGSLYVNKDWHGRSVGSKLMQHAIKWFNPEKSIELAVVLYNERAKSFYRKQGLVEIPDSESLFDDKIPEVKMVREGGADE